MTTLLEIIEAIQALSPGERRQLFRRLRTTGLLEADELWSDQNRLAVAPAVRKNEAAERASAPIKAPKPLPAPQGEPPPVQTNLPEPNAPTRQTPSPRNDEANSEANGEDEDYRSGVRSKVVMGAPSNRNERPLEIMEPVPGQAPEAPIRIIFDGGSRGNPGKGYGSYALDWPGLPQQVVQLRFGDGVTNNEAEYDTLISALEATIKKLEDSGAGPQDAQVEILGDSLLVVNQVLGKWASRDARMRTRCDRVQYLLSQFGRWHLAHHDRENSVRTLGH